MTATAPPVSAPKKGPVKKKAAKKAVKKPTKKKMGAKPQAKKIAKGKKLPEESRVVSLARIHILKGFNPRTSLGNLDTLKVSIKKTGLINPLTLRPQKGKDGHFLVVCGERRFRCLKSLGKKEVLVVIRHDLSNDLDARGVAIAENSDDARTDLNPIEKGRAFLGMQKKGWTAMSIAAKSGTGHQTVRRCLALMAVPEDIQKEVAAGERKPTQAIELAKMDPKVRAAIKSKINAKTTVIKLRQLAKAEAKAQGAVAVPGKRANKQTGAARSAAIRAWKASKPKLKQLAEFAYILTHAAKDEVGSTSYRQMEGAVAWALWDRGDIEEVRIPPLDPKQADHPATAKKERAAWLALLKAEAARHIVVENSE